jgi:hypothetical protein
MVHLLGPPISVSLQDIFWAHQYFFCYFLGVMGLMDSSIAHMIAKTHVIDIAAQFNQ